MSILKGTISSPILEKIISTLTELIKLKGLRIKGEVYKAQEIASVLRERGFTLEREKLIYGRDAAGSTVADFVATKGDETIVIEAKGRSLLHPSDIVPFAKLKEEAALPRARYIIITPDEPNSDVKEVASKKGVELVAISGLSKILP